jgi:hypothetical protein
MQYTGRRSFAAMTRTTLIRTAILAAAVATGAALPTASASADVPAAQCPPAFTLFAIPTDGSRPVAAALDAAGNQDGYACQKPHPAGEVEHVGSPYNVIENRVPLGA